MPQGYVSISVSPEVRAFAVRGLERLSVRELQILQDIVDSKTSKEIARERGISFRTVEHHKTNILLKLGINRTIEIFPILYTLSHEE